MHIAGLSLLGSIALGTGVMIGAGIFALLGQVAELSGSIQKHTLVYVVVIVIVLTIFFDLSRIASIGAIFYLVMDMITHWGVYKYLRKEVKANGDSIGFGFYRPGSFFMGQVYV